MSGTPRIQERSHLLVEVGRAGDTTRAPLPTTRSGSVAVPRLRLNRSAALLSRGWNSTEMFKPGERYFFSHGGGGWRKHRVYPNHRSQYAGGYHTGRLQGRPGILVTVKPMSLLHLDAHTYTHTHTHQLPVSENLRISR